MDCIAKKITDIIDSRREEIIAFARDIQQHPEPGFFEERTAAKTAVDLHNQTAHACGHHAQLAAMIGAALALADEEVRASLSGSVSFFAVPAEESIDADLYPGNSACGYVRTHSDYPAGGKK